jgi:hypothetical protein
MTTTGSGERVIGFVLSVSTVDLEGRTAKWRMPI